MSDQFHKMIEERVRWYLEHMPPPTSIAEKIEIVDRVLCGISYPHPLPGMKLDTFEGEPAPPVAERGDNAPGITKSELAYRLLKDNFLHLQDLRERCALTALNSTDPMNAAALIRILPLTTPDAMSGRRDDAGT